MNPCKHLKQNRGIAISQKEYARIIESLMYLTNNTKFNINYAINRFSRYIYRPSKDHWTAIIEVLKYLKGTTNLGLHYSGYPIVLEGYNDANWVSDSNESKSTSRFLFTLSLRNHPKKRVWLYLQRSRNLSPCKRKKMKLNEFII